jgi:hypothetical protein
LLFDDFSAWFVGDGHFSVAARHNPAAHRATASRSAVGHRHGVLRITGSGDNALASPVAAMIARIAAMRPVKNGCPLATHAALVAAATMPVKARKERTAKQTTAGVPGQQRKAEARRDGESHD